MLNGSRALIIAANPMEHSELRSIFSDRPESLRRALEHPPSLRDSGWDLPSITQAEFLNGELIRTVDRGRIVVDLYRDGTLAMGGKIHRYFLAWSDENDQRLHPLALVELTVNFTRFYRRVLEDFRNPPERIKFWIELKHMHLDGLRTLLPSGPVHRQPWAFAGGSRKDAPENTWQKDFVVPSKTYNPDRVAYQMIRELYLWFGHSDEAVPYTMESEEGEKIIDADEIARIR